MPLPVLDKAPTGRSHGWRLSQIKAEEPFPEEWENTDVIHIAERDQKNRGTCTGKSGAGGADLNYLRIKKDYPTDDDKSTFKKDVIEPSGVVHDVLYKISFSAECNYQWGREAGNIFYGEGGEIRYCAQAWRDRGMCLEKEWITDKEGNVILKVPPDPVGVALSAAKHTIKGWATVSEDFVSLKRAIYQKRWVWIAIPVYHSYANMRGGNGWFLDIFNGIAGFHALIAYGYTKDKIKVVHSWGKFCSRLGGFSETYFNKSKGLMEFIVVLDDEEVTIARDIYKSVLIKVRDTWGREIGAEIYINGIKTGISPIKIAVEHNRYYSVEARLKGYVTSQVTVDDSLDEVEIQLDLEPVVKKGFFQMIIEIIMRILRGRK